MATSKDISVLWDDEGCHVVFKDSEFVPRRCFTSAHPLTLIGSKEADGRTRSAEASAKAKVVGKGRT